MDYHLILITNWYLSMYTNIPMYLAIKSLKKRISISNKTKIPLNEFIRIYNLLYLILPSLILITIYKQIFGLPMRYPLSPIIANVILSDLEINVFASITIFIPVYTLSY